MHLSNLFNCVWILLAMGNSRTLQVPDPQKHPRSTLPEEGRPCSGDGRWGGGGGGGSREAPAVALSCSGCRVQGPYLTSLPSVP